MDDRKKIVLPSEWAAENFQKAMQASLGGKAKVTRTKFPVRDHYMHLTCFGISFLEPKMARRYATGNLPPKTRCDRCRNDFPHDQFRWEGGIPIGKG